MREAPERIWWVGGRGADARRVRDALGAASPAPIAPVTRSALARLRTGPGDVVVVGPLDDPAEEHGRWIEARDALPHATLVVVADTAAAALDALRCGADEALALGEASPDRLAAALARATARRAGERAGLRAGRRLEEFASAVVHDLEEPLRAVARDAEGLGARLGRGEDREAAHLGADLVRGVGRLRELLRALRDYAEGGARPLHVHEVESEAVVERALDNLKAMVEETEARVTRDPLPAIRADSLQLLRVFQNVIANALKFRSDEPPRVHVGIEPAEGGVTFFVRDEGIGLDPRHAREIFGAFRRLHAREAYEGTGMGLAICERIVTRHGGRIWVESRPGEGATIRFFLPG
jgi:light-regulated signal transduction histidine kinase (bacteriophytochrome)